MTKKNIAGGLLAGGAAGMATGAAGGIALGAITGVIMKYTYDRHIHGKHMHKKLKSLSRLFKKPSPSIARSIYPERPRGICVSICF